jgi:hypothetical protein
MGHSCPYGGIYRPIPPPRDKRWTLTTVLFSPVFHAKYDNQFWTFQRKYVEYMPTSSWQIKCGFKQDPAKTIPWITPKDVHILRPPPDPNPSDINHNTADYPSPDTSSRELQAPITSQPALIQTHGGQFLGNIRTGRNMGLYPTHPLHGFPQSMVHHDLGFLPSLSTGSAEVTLYVSIC